MPENIAAISGLLVAVGALLVSVGVFYLIYRLGDAIDALSATRRNSDQDQS